MAETGPLPVDLRQSPDDRFLLVSCFGADFLQQWQVSDLEKPQLAGPAKLGTQPNRMHVTGDGQRRYVTNSLLSTMDRDDHFWVKLVRIGPDGMTVDPSFAVDLTTFPTGPARGQDMLPN